MSHSLPTLGVLADNAPAVIRYNTEKDTLVHAETARAGGDYATAAADYQAAARTDHVFATQLADAAPVTALSWQLAQSAHTRQATALAALIGGDVS